MCINSSIIVKEINFSIGMNWSFYHKAGIREFTESIMKLWYPKCLIVILISDNDFGIDVMKWYNSFRLHLVNVIINLKHSFFKIKSSCWRSTLANKELSGILGLDFQSAAALSCHSCPIKDLETYKDHPTSTSNGIKTVYEWYSVSLVGKMVDLNHEWQ